MLASALWIGCSSKRTQNLETVGGPPPDLTNQPAADQSLEAGKGGPLADIHFGYNDYTIQPQDNSILQSNANWLRAHPNTNVQIGGNCDERGSEDYNIALGARRAQSAKDYLVTMGISPARISTISYGKELPVCHESNEDCWQQNRRDHFAVSGGGQASK